MTSLFSNYHENTPSFKMFIFLSLSNSQNPNKPFPHSITTVQFSLSLKKNKEERKKKPRKEEEKMMMTGRASKLVFSKLLYKPLLPESMNDLPTICLLHHFSTTPPRNNSNRPPPPMMGGGETRNDEDGFLQKFESSYDHDLPPPNPIPNRPLRGEKRFKPLGITNNNNNSDEEDERMKPSSHRSSPPRAQFENRSMRVGGGGDRSVDRPPRKVPFNSNLDPPPVQFHNINKPPPPITTTGEKADDQSVASYLEKFHLGDEKKEGPFSNLLPETPTESPPEDADEIFKNMKETGLIPNAVSMLDGLCKDGLVKEAMKLFGLMREKGTIPEVVIYTAVVEGFCRAQKLEDAKRIFRKMQNNGISPNAFSYTVLIQGLCKAKRLEDAIDFCVEMLEAAHSPNLLTFVSLVDGVCTKEGLEEAENVILRLKEKGFFVNEKAVREHLDKKGSFSPLVWEAIFGKKTSQRPF